MVVFALLMITLDHLIDMLFWARRKISWASATFRFPQPMPVRVGVVSGATHQRSRGSMTTGL
jgi:hypothetical protein